jgi:SAM-dependent methyltransferase
MTDWDDVLQDWEMSRAHALWRAHSDAVNRALLQSWLPEGDLGRVLKTDLFDEVVGTGLVPALRGRAREVVGIDVARSVVDAAGRRHPDLSARVADVRRLPFADESFDVIVSNSTLDHFESLSSLTMAQAELRRVSRPAARVIVTLDNRQNPVVALRTSRALAGAFRRLGLVPYELGVTCGRRRLAALLERCGFSVTTTTAIMHCPPQLAAAVTSRIANGRSCDEGRYLGRVLAFERMEGWLTRYFTGHFVAACAVPRAGRPAG